MSPQKPIPDIHEFSQIDFIRPLDVEAFIARTPEGRKAPGVMMREIGRRLGGEAEKIFFDLYPRPFDMRPIRDMMRAAFTAAQAAFPDEPLAQASRLLMREAYPALRTTLIGRGIFAAFDDDFHGMLHVINSAAEQGIPGATMTLVDAGKYWAIIEYRGDYMPRCMDIGAFEGLAQTFGLEARVLVRQDTYLDGDILLDWRPSSAL